MSCAPPSDINVKIFNLTQHPATEEQIADGVIEPAEETKKFICELLTFDELPTREVMIVRANVLAKIVSCAGYKKTLIGGAPYFMSFLENSLKTCNIQPLYAFSKRESVEEIQPDGSVKKIAIFKHCGFMEA